MVAWGQEMVQASDSQRERRGERDRQGDREGERDLRGRGSPGRSLGFTARTLWNPGGGVSRLGGDMGPGACFGETTQAAGCIK